MLKLSGFIFLYLNYLTDIFMKLRRINLELLFWISSLFFILFFPLETTSISICPSQLLGIHFCPGCGIGASIHYFLSGQIGLSFESHPLGIIATFIIIHRIYSLLKDEAIPQKLTT